MSRNWKKKAARGIKAAFYAAFLGLNVSLTTLSVCAEETYQVEEVQLQGTITTDSALNVRSGPGKNYDVIAKVGNDTVLTITGKADNGWYQVEIDGKTGFVSDAYVNASSAESDTAQEKLEKEAGEPEEGYHGLRLSPFVLKILLAVVGIVIVGAMLFATLRSLKGDEDDEDDDEAEDDEDEDDDGDDEDDEDDDEEYEEELRRRKRRKKAVAAQEKKTVKEHKNRKETLKKAPKKEYVLREEDYRVQIDPSFFEEKEPIEQPAMVTGYLERKKIEEEAERQRQQKEARAVAERENEAEKRSQQADQKQQELDQAMQKLDELQKEIERLKNLQ